MTQKPRLLRAAIVLVVAGSLGPALSGQTGASSIELLSVTPGGTAGGGQVFLESVLYDRGPQKISADNRYVVFASGSDQLVAGDVNGRQDIFVRDRETATTSLASLASDGTPSNGESGEPVISANGRYVAFVSWASNLVPGDANNTIDVFVRDLQTGTTALASVSTGGVQDNFGAYNPTISADGRYVAFASSGDVLVAGGEANLFNVDVFVRDMLLGTTARVSVRPDGSQIIGADSSTPSISADGRRIAFVVWNNTLGGPTPQVPPNLHHGVYVRDLNTGQTILVSVRPDGTPSDHLVSLDPVISANGRYVAFTNWEDLDPNFPDAAEESLLDGPFADIFVRDLQTGLTHRASLPFPGGPAEESGGVATISADGRYVAYLNNNLIRLRDRVTGTTREIDGVGGVPADGFHEYPAISEDGQFVYFGSWAANLVANDANGILDAYLYRASPLADLSLTLGASTIQPALNSDVTFTIALANNGPDDAAGVAVRVPMPAGLSVVSDTGGGGYDAVAGIWTVGALASGSSATLQVVGRFTSPSVVTVTAQVSASSLGDPDSTPDNNAPAEDDHATVVLTPSIADLSLGLAANTTSPAVNSNVTLSITVTNGGPVSATGIVARMPLPAALTFVSATPAAAYDAATGVWTLAAVPVGAVLPSGATIGMQVVARVTSAAPIDVTAQISAATQSDPDSTPGNDAALEDDQRTVQLTPVVADGIVVNNATTAVNANDGRCTLIEAIVAANTDLPSGNALGECAGGNGPDTIHLRAVGAPKAGALDQYLLTAVHNTVNGPNGVPPISSVITIEGGIADLRRVGGPPFRLFYVAPGAHLTLKDLAFHGGLLPAAAEEWAQNGGAILNAGVLVLDNTYFTGNTANCGGGAIASAGPLTVRASTLQNNTAGCSGGAIFTYFAGQLQLIDTTLQFNQAPNGSGGGLMVLGTTAATVTNSVFNANTARLDGGGLLAHDSSVTISVIDSRIINNTVTGGHGGGIANGRLRPDDTFGGVLLSGGTMTIDNSTISNNVAANGYGGGLVNAGSLAMTSSVVSANQLTGLKPLQCGGGIYSAATLTMVASSIAGNIVAGNAGGGLCAFGGASVTVTQSSFTGNSASKFGGGIAFFQMPGAVLTGVTIQGNTAGWDGGGLYGGFVSSLVLDNTRVHQNGTGEAGGGLWLLGSNVTFRNDTRVTGNTAATSGGGIALAHAGPCCAASLAMTGGLIDGNTANGPSASSTGGGGLANHDTHAATVVTLDAVTVSNNRAPIGDGGGIFNFGTVVMNGGVLMANTALSGGAFANGTSTQATGPATLNGVTIENNVATSLGGAFFIANPPAPVATSAVAVNGGTIWNNRAVNGGAFFLRPNAILNVGAGTTIGGNAATATGGAINNAGTLSLTGVTVSGNTADIGGAIHTAGPSTITGSTFTGNAARVGAGLRVTAGVTDISNSTLSGNTATVDGGGALHVTGVVLPGGGNSSQVNLSASTVVANTGNPGGILNGGRIHLLSTILAGNRRPDGTVSECAWGLVGLFQYGSNVIGLDPGCDIAVPNAGAAQRVVDPATLFTRVLGPLADNGGPTQTHLLLPGSIAIDATSPLSCQATDQRGQARPVDGDGDGTALCDIGAHEEQGSLPSPAAALTSLSPAFAVAGPGALNLTATGTGFVAATAAFWNGTPRQTFAGSPTQLTISLLPGDLSSLSDISTAQLTVANPGTPASNALPFTIVSANISSVHTQIAAAGTSVTASNAPTIAGQGGVTATLTNNDPLSPPATVSVATYAMDPIGGVTFAAGGFYDLQVIGADPTDSVAARFYYPSTVTGATEAGLQLQYWNGAAWASVIGSGGAVPDKNITNNLDGTVSGGRFGVTLDNTSTPGITDLGGTVFALMSIDDVAPPVTTAGPSPAANAKGWHNTDVTVTLTATDESSGVAATEFNLDHAGWKPYGEPIRIRKEGVHTLRFRSRDRAGNTEPAQTLTVRIDKTAPLLLALATPVVLWPANNKLQDIVVWVFTVDLLSGDEGFKLVSVVSDEPDPGADDMQGWTIGTADTRGKLRAERSSAGDGRVYTLTYRVVDRAGNTTVDSTKVRVPRR